MCALPVVRILTPGDQSGIDNHRDGKHIWRTTREIVRLNGVAGLWRGTTATLLRSVSIRRIRVVASISHAHICSNVPGVALYFTGLNQFRTLMATSRYFASVRTQAPNSHGSTLPKLTMQGNLLAGATTRVTVGLALNPFSVLKARYEVSVLWLLYPVYLQLNDLFHPLQSNLYSYDNIFTAFRSIMRAGPTELFRGVLPSALRDAPYAGLFVVFYESIKSETSEQSPVCERTNSHASLSASSTFQLVDSSHWYP